MGQLTNLYVSESYQGLLKMTDSTNGLTSTLQTVQTGDGDNSPLQMSLTQVNISGSLTINGNAVSNVDTGSFLTTSSFNAYTSSVDLRFDGIEVETGSLQNQINQKLDTGSFNIYSGNTLNLINTKLDTGSFNTYSGNTLNLINTKLDTGSFNSYTGSNDARVNDLISKTGSYVTETESGSFVTNVTGGPISFEDQIIITKGNGSTSTVTINNVTQADSASYSNYSDNSGLLNGTGSGVFATTGSNNFVGQQNINGTTNITGSLNVSGTITATSASITYLETVYETASVIYSSGSNQLGDASNDVQTLWGTVVLPSGSLDITGSIKTDINSFVDSPIFLNSRGQVNLFSNGGDVNLQSIGTGSITLNSKTNINANVSVTGSVILSGSAGVELDVKGDQTNTGSLTVRSGNLSYVSNNTINIDNYLTSSEAGQSNLIKGWGDNPTVGGAGAVQANYTGSLRITGSNNTVSMPQIRATNIGGGTDQQGYISGSENTIGGNNAGIFLNTGSLLFPKTTNNLVGNASFISMNFTTSSLAGGHPVVQNNTLYAGNATLNHNSGSATLTGNILNGGQLTSTQNFVTNIRPNLTTNIINGSAATLNHISGSVTLTANIINAGGVTINNAVSSSIANNTLAVNGNMFVGGFGGTVHTIFASGSQNSNAARQINNNLIGGASNVISSSFVSSSNSNLQSTLMYGNSLAVSASHTTGQFGGSAFLGRFNDTGSLASAQDIVFAVGTGISSANRRTGLYVTSNSLVGVSGSLQVVGNTSISGNTSLLTGSVTIETSDATTGSLARMSFVNGTTAWSYNRTTLNSSWGAVNNIYQVGGQFGLVSGSQSNAFYGGFAGQAFRSGSNNIIFNATFDNFVSGSGNLIIGQSNNGLVGGSNNTFIGPINYPSGSIVENRFQVNSVSGLIMTKDGTNPLQIGDDVEVTGSLTLVSGSGTNDLYMYGHKMFNVGVFYSTQTQSGSAAVSQSINYNTTDISQGVSLVAGSQLTLANAGTYNIQFSAQVLADTGADDVWFWLKKNGTNVPDTAGRITLANNDELMAAWNYVITANAGDYIELVWQNANGDAVLLYNAPTGNIPAVTSIITTVTQVR